MLRERGTVERMGSVNMGFIWEWMKKRLTEWGGVGGQSEKFKEVIKKSRSINVFEVTMNY